MDEINKNLELVNDVDLLNGFYFMVEQSGVPLKSNEQIDKYIYSQLKKINNKV